MTINYLTGLLLEKVRHTAILTHCTLCNRLITVVLSGFPGWLRWERIHLPMLETWVRSLGWEDLLENGMASHSSILAWRILWTEELGRL